MSLQRVLTTAVMGLVAYSSAALAVDPVSVFSGLGANEKITIKVYDLPKSQAEVRAASPEALPSSKVLLYNVFTVYGNTMDGNYVRGIDIDHILYFCNVSPKAVTVNMVFAIDGPSPSRVQGKLKNALPNKCYAYTWKRSYDYTGIYLFAGAAIPKGEGANVLTTDTSKFRIY